MGLFDMNHIVTDQAPVGFVVPADVNLVAVSFINMTLMDLDAVNLVGLTIIDSTTS